MCFVSAERAAKSASGETYESFCTIARKQRPISTRLLATAAGVERESMVGRPSAVIVEEMYESFTNSKRKSVR